MECKVNITLHNEKTVLWWWNFNFISNIFHIKVDNMKDFFTLVLSDFAIKNQHYD